MFKARSSKIGNLMIGGSSFTEENAALLKEYEQRSINQFVSPSGKMLGPIKDMKQKMSALIAKKKKGFVFGQTSLSYIQEKWMFDKFGYRNPIVTIEMLKGQMCEQDTMRLVDSVYPVSVLRTKCKRSMSNDFSAGTCDVELEKEDTIEDIKTSWDLRTFFSVESYPELYYAQGQDYMDLYGKSKFRLFYGLVDTPNELIEQELSKYRYKFGGDYDNKHYKEIEEQIYLNHKPSQMPGLTEVDRIKVFEFDRNQEYINEMRSRVVMARPIYNSLTISQMKHRIQIAA